MKSFSLKRKSPTSAWQRSMSSTKRSHRRYNWRAVDAVAAAVVAVMAAVATAAAVVAVAMQVALMLAALAVATSVAARTWADALIWEDVTWVGATVVAVAMDAASSSEDASAALAAAEDVAMAAAATPVGYGRRLVGFTAARLTHRQRRKDSDQR
jgi:tellurite resistance protein TehA-like permease